MREMVMSLVAGKPHAAKTDQPGDFRQYHEHQDQQPVFGAARSSGEVEIMAERPLDQLADGHDLVSNSWHEGRSCGQFD